MTLTTYHKKDLVWITLKVILQIEMSKLSLFGILAIFSKKLASNFLYSGMNLPKDGTNQLPKARFDGITLKVILQGRKGLNFSILARSFPKMVTMNCKEKDLIESL